MNTILNLIEAPQSLSKRAVLVDLTVHQWRPVRSDERADAAVQAEFNTDRSAGSFRKQLLPQQPVAWKRVTAAAAAIGAAHRFWTQPWAAGVRILASAVYNDYSVQMRKLQTQYDEVVDAFVSQYPALRDEAMFALHGLARDSDYPAEDKIRARFGVTIATMPLPEVGDFRVGVDRDAVAAMRDSYQQMLNNALEQSQSDLWARLKDAVEKVRGSVATYSARLESREAGGEQRAVLKEGSFDALREIIEVLPRMNLADDTALEEMVAEVATKVGSFDTEALRESPIARVDIIKQADAISDRMAAFMKVA